MKSSIKEFIAESEEILEDAGEFLLKIQETIGGEIDPDLVNALFRAMHTLKGMAGLFGFQGITDVSHDLEDLLDDVRLGKIEITEEVIAFLFKFVDILHSLIENLKSKPEAKENVSKHLEKIKKFRESLLKKGETESIKGVISDEILKVLSEYEEHRLKSNLKEEKGIYLIKTVFSLMEFDTLLKDLTEKIKDFGELISTMPTSEDVPDGSIGFNLMVGSSMTGKRLKEGLKFNVDELVKPVSPAGVTIVLDEVPELEEETDEVSEAVSLKKATTTVRVDIEKLDGILNTIGEMFLVRNSVKNIWTELSDEYGHTPLVINYYRIGQSLERRLAELQSQVLSIRMVPIGQIFSRLGQVIRRYSRGVGKKLDLQVFGENTEIDKFLAEEVIDPLVHIVRNAVDHGIESVSERKAKGKEEAGNIRLRAFQQGNSVVVEVEDDGGGMDVEKIKKRALEMGLIRQTDELMDREIYDLLFTPGFSTSESVSEVSGRGVGLDIVKDKLSSLGGIVELHSKKDEGTTFVLTLPITLAIIRALMVKTGDKSFAIPVTSMSETLVVNHSSIQTIENRKVYNLRGELLPMTSLQEILGLPEVQTERSFAVVVGHGEKKAGLLVDDLLGQQEVVIKSLGEYFKGLKGFAGAAEIGRHEVVLVIDVEAIIEESLSRKGAAYV
jgi:two-component system chemotaxis sensor kinase CheA